MLQINELLIRSLKIDHVYLSNAMALIPLFVLYPGLRELVKSKTQNFTCRERGSASAGLLVPLTAFSTSNEPQALLM